MALDLATVLQRDTYHKQQKENRGELGLGQKLKRGRNKSEKMPHGVGASRRPSGVGDRPGPEGPERP